MLYSSYSLILLIRSYGISHCWLSDLLGASRLLAKRPLKMDLRVPAVHHWQMTTTFMFRLNGPTSAEGAGVQIQIPAPIGIGQELEVKGMVTSFEQICTEKQNSASFFILRRTSGPFSSRTLGLCASTVPLEEFDTGRKPSRTGSRLFSYPATMPTNTSIGAN